MKVIYDREADALSVILSDATVVESDEENPGIILDYDASGNLVSLEGRIRGTDRAVLRLAGRH